MGKNNTTAKERLAICYKCPNAVPHGNPQICNLCGCVLKAKTRVNDEHCPIKKW